MGGTLWPGPLPNKNPHTHQLEFAEETHRLSLLAHPHAYYEPSDLQHKILSLT